MKRRDLFKMTGALVAVPGAAAAQVPKTATPAPQPIEPPWKPQVLTAHQNDTIVALTDLIIPETDTPGAKAANINRYIDLFLKDTPPDQTETLLAGLGWLDYYANKKYGHAFIGCTQDDQIAMLTAFDSNTSQDAALQAGHDFFNIMKSITARFYYNTAIGFRELNKGGRVPAGFGCVHGGHA
jgi:hypothetical protein